MEERLQKLISAAGICSRRHAEALLAEGKVTVNGAPAHVGDRADPDRDEIRVEGVLLRRQEKMVYLMLNKPRGVVTTLQDEKGRPTVADLVRDCGARVYPVGRLDMDSEGLLLLTNDGALMQRLLHPSFGVDKTYRVVVAGAVGQAARRLAAVTALEDGTTIRPAQVETMRRGGDHHPRGEKPPDQAHVRPLRSARQTAAAGAGAQPLSGRASTWKMEVSDRGGDCGPSAGVDSLENSKKRERMVEFS